jgi:hypothetical protein
VRIEEERPKRVVDGRSPPARTLIGTRHRDAVGHGHGMASQYYCIINLLYLLPSYPPYLSFYSSSSSRNPEPCPPLVPCARPHRSAFCGGRSAEAPTERQCPGPAQRNARSGWGACATSGAQRTNPGGVGRGDVAAASAPRQSVVMSCSSFPPRAAPVVRAPKARTRPAHDPDGARAQRTNPGGARRRRCRVSTSSAIVLLFHPSSERQRPGPDQRSAYHIPHKQDPAGGGVRADGATVQGRPLTRC